MSTPPIAPCPPPWPAHPAYGISKTSPLRPLCSTPAYRPCMAFTKNILTHVSAEPRIPFFLLCPTRLEKGRTADGALRLASLHGTTVVVCSSKKAYREKKGGWRGQCVCIHRLWTLTYVSWLRSSVQEKLQCSYVIKETSLYSRKALTMDVDTLNGALGVWNIMRLLKREIWEEKTCCRTDGDYYRLLCTRTTGTPWHEPHTWCVWHTWQTDCTTVLKLAACPFSFALQVKEGEFFRREADPTAGSDQQLKQWCGTSC